MANAHVVSLVPVHSVWSNNYIVYIYPLCIIELRLAKRHVGVRGIVENGVRRNRAKLTKSHNWPAGLVILKNKREFFSRISL